MLDTSFIESVRESVGKDVTEVYMYQAEAENTERDSAVIVHLLTEILVELRYAREARG